MRSGLDQEREPILCLNAQEGPAANNYYSSVLNVHLFNSELGDGEIRVLLALHSYCPRKDVVSGKCQTFVSVHLLAVKLGCSDREVKRRLRRLEAVKAIHTTTRKGTSNIYTLLRADQSSSARHDSQVAVDDDAEGKTL